MILLADIDHRAVLDGAHVPLTDLDPVPGDEWHWCGSFGIRVNKTRPGHGDNPNWFADLWTIHQLGHVDIALDPTDPAVAALLDRRIAEAWRARHTPAHPTGVYDRFSLQPDQVGHRRHWHWSIRCVTSGGWGSLTLTDWMDVAPAPKNIPAARTALIKALYPPRTP